MPRTYRSLQVAQGCVVGTNAVERGFTSLYCRIFIIRHACGVPHNDVKKHPLYVQHQNKILNGRSQIASVCFVMCLLKYRLYARFLPMRVRILTPTIYWSRQNPVLICRRAWIWFHIYWVDVHICGFCEIISLTTRFGRVDCMVVARED